MVTHIRRHYQMSKSDFRWWPQAHVLNARSKSAHLVRSCSTITKNQWQQWVYFAQRRLTGLQDLIQTNGANNFTFCLNHEYTVPPIKEM